MNENDRQGVVQVEDSIEEPEKPLTEMSNEEIELFISSLREKRKNVSMKKIEERNEKAEEKREKVKKKDTFAGDNAMNSLLDDILGDI